ncbi:MAG TPA: hypothetical protein VLB09_08655, partial [Nitrospiria bacterium]|nr:hypothetical protein [Nitrospiria bacterium]
MRYKIAPQKTLWFPAFFLVLSILAGCDGTPNKDLSGLPGTPDPVTEQETPELGGTTGGDGNQGGPAPDPFNWHLILVVSVPDSSADGGMAKNYLTAGQKSAATKQFDLASDLPAILAGSLNAFFNHSSESGYNSNLNQDKLWADYRAPGFPENWDIDVMGPGGEDVTVTWVLPSGDISCATHSFLLEDQDGVLPLTDLCGGGSLVYTADG